MKSKGLPSDLVSNIRKRIAGEAMWAREIGEFESAEYLRDTAIALQQAEMLLMQHERGAVEARAVDQKLPVCDICDDTHRMWWGDERMVPCTKCPLPCRECRSGAYCEHTPCACSCHKPEGAR